MYFTQHILGSQREKQHRQRKCRKFDTFNFNTEQMKSCPQKPALLNLRITIETQLRPFKLSTLSFSAIGGGRSILPSQFSLMLNNALMRNRNKERLEIIVKLFLLLIKSGHKWPILVQQVKTRH